MRKKARTRQLVTDAASTLRSLNPQADQVGAVRVSQSHCIVQKTVVGRRETLKVGRDVCAFDVVGLTGVDQPNSLYNAAVDVTLIGQSNSQLHHLLHGRRASRRLPGSGRI